MNQKNEHSYGASFEPHDNAAVHRYADGRRTWRAGMEGCWGLLLIAFVVLVSAEASSKDNIAPALRDMDTNNDGVITSNEWRVATASDRSFNDRAQTFHDLDRNGDGGLAGTEVTPSATKTSDSSASFRALDRNSDSVISRGEWQGVTDTFTHLDLNNSGSVSPEEFDIRAGRDRFHDLDRDSDGFLTRAEWPDSSRSYYRLDRNSDGQVTRAEFANTKRLSPAVFSDLDLNKDNVISRSEWKNSSIEFNGLDTNGDNVLSEKEVYNTHIEPRNAVEDILQQIFN